MATDAVLRGLLEEWDEREQGFPTTTLDAIHDALDVPLDDLARAASPDEARAAADALVAAWESVRPVIDAAPRG